MKPDYKEIKPHQWIEIIKAGCQNTVLEIVIDTTESPCMVAWVKQQKKWKSHESTYEIAMMFDYETDSFCDVENDLAAFRKMSEYIYIGIGDNYKEIYKHFIK